MALLWHLSFKSNNNITFLFCEIYNTDTRSTSSCSIIFFRFNSKNNKTSRVSCKFLSHFHNTVLLFGLFFLFFLLSFSHIASTATAKITQAKQRHSIILVLAKKNTENQVTKQNAWASPFSSLSTDWNFNYFPLNIAQQLETQVEND